MQPRILLRVEGVAIGLAGAGGYLVAGGEPLLFVLLVLLPDVSIAGYLARSRVGSVAYNAVHALTLPIVLLAWAVWAGHDLGVLAGYAWLAHVGADRAFGLGLKYGDAPFRETHLQRI